MAKAIISPLTGETVPFFLFSIVTSDNQFSVSSQSAQKYFDYVFTIGDLLTVIFKEFL